MDAELSARCWFLAGPTACGKSDVALELATRHKAEIVALDSMTLYRELDIGTAKPTPAERQQVPHHLFDLLDPAEEYSVAEYHAAAEAVARDILARGRTPLFVGGTGLYLRALLRGVFAGPPADAALRERLESHAATHGPQDLHRQLAQIDAITAARLSPHDVRRVVRALEVFELTGVPLSAHQQQAPLPEEQRPPHVYWLSPPRDWLHDRINRRVIAMFERGLVEEVRRLWQRTPPLGRTARQALGYKELLDRFDAGLCDNGLFDTAPAIEQIQTRTRQFAKRQHTWFRNLVECTAVDITAADTVPAIVERLEQHLFADRHAM